jgi:hypothetical protein
MRQVATLGELVGRLEWHEVGCDRGSRHSIYSMVHLQLAASCQHHTGRGTPQCGACYPQLPGLFLAPSPC